MRYRTLIDNSITAGARNIRLHFQWAGADSWVSILDDGCGMSEPALIDAMRIGSRSPREAREPSDLGRYGLGLKTASISQARSLTVATRIAGRTGTSAKRWDLDHLASTGDWQLLNVPVEAVSHGVDSLSQSGHGTLVVWEKLDRLVGDAGTDDARAQRQFLESLRAVEEHIAMVFHRLMVRPRPISIRLNGQAIKPWDPFLADDPATQRLPTENLGEPGDGVTVTPYVLPHHTRLSVEKHRAAAGPPDGTPSRASTSIETGGSSLRVTGWIWDFKRRSITNWPASRLTFPIPTIMNGTSMFGNRWPGRRCDTRTISGGLRRRPADGRSPYTGIGARPSRRGVRESPVFVWQRHVRGNRVSYVVNRDHPLIRYALMSESIDVRELRQILRLIEEYVPVQQIWGRYGRRR